MIQKILPVLRQHNWKIFKAPYELNIVGVRSENTRANSFDDFITVFFKDERGKWEIKVWEATTDPGLPYLHTPINLNLGTAILAMGQYLNAYRIDKHRDKYYALCQRLGPVTVVRDYDRDDFLDYQNGERISGNYGINIHRSVAIGSANFVANHSAGCQVFKHAKDFDEFMRLCEVHRKIHGNTFTYSLIDFRAVKRANRKKWLKRLAILAGVSTLTALGITALRSANSN